VAIHLHENRCKEICSHYRKVLESI
jgi:hypothetical protein